MEYFGKRYFKNTNKHVEKNDKCGTVFNMVLNDNHAQIRVTVFNELVDKFYDKIQVNKNYFFANGIITDANKKYSNIKNNFEIMLTKDSLVEESTETNLKFPTIDTIFETISKLNTLPVSSLFKINAIRYEVKGIQDIVAKSTGYEYTKRDVALIDSSNETITLTLWNNDAENFDTVTLINVRLTEYNGKKSISLTRNTEMKLNENTPNTNSLKQ